MRDEIRRLLPSRSCLFCSLTVAGLRLGLEVVENDFSITLPPAQSRFATPGEQSDLSLAVRLRSLREVDGWEPVCTSYPTWQLWRDGSGCLVFVAGQLSRPGRQVTVDAGFRSGEVLVEPDTAEKPTLSLYPLADLDIILFANWLAGSGDLILHASGVEFEGRGYCFTGPSGAGKSTMAAAFVRRPGLTVLGEDNLVLRRVDGRFWVYGTPWHLNPALCSPRGVPLEKLFFLDRTAEAGIYDCSPLQGVVRLLQTAFVPYYRQDAASDILENLALLAQRVPFYTLSHRLGSDVMGLIAEA